MFEVGKEYKDRWGDKVLCCKRDDNDGTFYFKRDVHLSFGFWTYSDGRLIGVNSLMAYIIGPWAEQDKEGN